MSEIIEVVRKGDRYTTATLRVRCATCGRVHVVTCTKTQARRQVRCAACKLPGGNALPRGGRKTRAQRGAQWRAEAAQRLGRHA